MNGRPDAAARAAGLIGMFCGDLRLFGEILPVMAAAVPPAERSLLDHRSHMTVTMERHHGCSVDLQVLAERHADDSPGTLYAREILLRRPDASVVQYGIVRIDFAVIDPAAAAAIRAKSAPLGRILVSAGLLCDVQGVELLRIEPGPYLRDRVGNVGTMFGRVAEIAVDRRPAIELLEVVVPTSRGRLG